MLHCVGIVVVTGLQRTCRTGVAILADARIVAISVAGGDRTEEGIRRTGLDRVDQAGNVDTRDIGLADARGVGIADLPDRRIVMTALLVDSGKLERAVMLIDRTVVALSDLIHIGGRTIRRLVDRRIVIPALLVRIGSAVFAGLIDE